MSASDDSGHNDTEEQESWADLFGSVRGLADEVGARISPEEVEERLRRTLRRAGYRAAAAASVGGTVHLTVGHRSFTATVGMDRPEPVSPHRRQLLMRPRLLYRAGAPPHPAQSPPAPPEPSPRSPGFWGELDRADQLAFRQLAGERRYAVGEELMREGETADHVVVIRVGRTAVSVRDGGTQRVVAYRGPGELVGERAALQVSVRSATVVAVEPVVALVMRTQDFAAYLSAHPAVLTIIEDMVYQRLTENPGRLGYGPVAESVSRGELDDYLRPQRQNIKPRRLDGKHCTVVAVDVVGFGGVVRNNDDRLFVHDTMVDMTQAALTGTWEKCVREDRGDGMLILVPAAIPTLSIVERLTGNLPAALRRHNRVYNVCAQIQLRIAVDTGLVESRDRGMTGKALSQAWQLLKTPDLTDAISRSRANLGMILSSDVYDSAIRPQGGPLSYGEVWLGKRGASPQAWMQMIDPAPERLALPA